MVLLITSPKNSHWPLKTEFETQNKSDFVTKFVWRSNNTANIKLLTPVVNLCYDS